MMQDKILVLEPKLKAIQTAQGIVIPTDNTALQVMTAEVVEVGPGKKIGKKFRPTIVKKGDTIVFSKSIAIQTTINGVKYLIVHEDDIVGINAAVVSNKLVDAEEIKDLLIAKLLGFGLTQLPDMNSPVDRGLQAVTRRTSKQEIADISKDMFEGKTAFAFFQVLPHEGDYFLVRIAFK